MQQQKAWRSRGRGESMQLEGITVGSFPALNSSGSNVLAPEQLSPQRL
jgi:hypothetical protein